MTALEGSVAALIAEIGDPDAFPIPGIGAIVRIELNSALIGLAHQLFNCPTLPLLAYSRPILRGNHRFKLRLMGEYRPSVMKDVLFSVAHEPQLYENFTVVR